MAPPRLKTTQKGPISRLRGPSFVSTHAGEAITHAWVVEQSKRGKNDLCPRMMKEAFHLGPLRGSENLCFNSHCGRGRRAAVSQLMLLPAEARFRFSGGARTQRTDRGTDFRSDRPGQSKDQAGAYAEPSPRPKDARFDILRNLQWKDGQMRLSGRRYRPSEAPHKHLGYEGNPYHDVFAGPSSASFNRAEASVSFAIAACLPAIAAFVGDLIPLLRRSGRLIYVFAENSGRVAHMDCAELPVTNSVDREQFLAVVAGGIGAVLEVVEGAEDLYDDGAAKVYDLCLTSQNTVIGISSSERTPFVTDALTAAITRGSSRMGSTGVNHPLVVSVGPEFVTGGTRLKAGSCAKNAPKGGSTRERDNHSKSDENASIETLIERCRGSVKLACAVGLSGLHWSIAKRRLDGVDGHVQAFATRLE
ncbi:N-acetylmuramic acid 6-phosphate etherase [Verticillium alfalfae VaMs.102]|uniref:N-acetylmuramic acid 6-phosphate etherase n=1 Tax=Verticillium alfalfae (strain VaMs.102 / ATCC MYA-4576 / FGSC 10136) TaxID=526221 RepID=C9SXZ0_VERA1|nr:N-acetylmuramic acid 6-phosphate etherase [Verticillium alfalfae VaMs.102]EEY23655.1 N-acetylmuramic acid 6-phosphate etherase [Verticillium alfalfae VaMs.102]